MSSSRLSANEIEGNFNLFGKRAKFKVVKVICDCDEIFLII